MWWNSYHTWQWLCRERTVLEEVIFTVFTGLHRKLTSAQSNTGTSAESQTSSHISFGIVRFFWLNGEQMPSFRVPEIRRLETDSSRWPWIEMFNNAWNFHMSTYFWPESKEPCVMNQNLGCSNYFHFRVFSWLINSFFLWRLTYSQVGIRSDVVSCKASPSFIIIWEDNFLFLHTVVSSLLNLLRGPFSVAAPRRRFTIRCHRQRLLSGSHSACLTNQSWVVLSVFQYVIVYHFACHYMKGMPFTSTSPKSP